MKCWIRQKYKPTTSTTKRNILGFLSLLFPLLFPRHAALGQLSLLKQDHHFFFHLLCCTLFQVFQDQIFLPRISDKCSAMFWWVSGSLLCNRVLSREFRWLQTVGSGVWHGGEWPCRLLRVNTHESIWRTNNLEVRNVLRQIWCLFVFLFFYLFVFQLGCKLRPGPGTEPLRKWLHQTSTHQDFKMMIKEISISI